MVLYSLRSVMYIVAVIS